MPVQTVDHSSPDVQCLSVCLVLQATSHTKKSRPEHGPINCRSFFRRRSSSNFLHSLFSSITNTSSASPLLLSSTSGHCDIKPSWYLFRSISINQPKCPATTPISLCAESNPVSPSAGSATSAMANAPSAIPTCVQRLWSASATSAPLVTTRTSASCAVVRGSVTRSTASSVRVWRRIAMAARRLSIWEVRGRICSTRKRVFGIIDLLPGFGSVAGVLRVSKMF